MTVINAFLLTVMLCFAEGFIAGPGLVMHQKPSSNRAPRASVRSLRPLQPTSQRSKLSMCEDPSKVGAENKVDEGPSKGLQFLDIGKDSQMRFKARDATEEDQAKLSVLDDLKPVILGLSGVAAAIAAASAMPGAPPSLPLILTFVLGYVGIVFESEIDINKSATAIVMGVVCWALVGPAAGLGTDQVLPKIHCYAFTVSLAALQISLPNTQSRTAVRIQILCAHCDLHFEAELLSA